MSDSPNVNPVEAGMDAVNSNQLDVSTQMDANIKTQLSQPGDVQAAHQYFQSGGGGNTLPDLSLDSSLGAQSQSPLPDLTLDAGMPHGYTDATLGSLNPAGTGTESLVGAGQGGGTEAIAGKMVNGIESVLHNLPGMEQALMPGLEQGVLGMPPGTEPISPMIQMILKMPGHIGLIGNFFEALMSFLFPADGGFLALLDPTMWAQTAQQAFGSIIGMIGESIPMTVSFVNNLNPFFTNLINNPLFMNNQMFHELASTATQSPSVDIAFSGTSGVDPTFVGGQLDPAKPLFESSAIDGDPTGSLNLSYDRNSLLAMEGNAFGPTMGGQYSTVNVTPDPTSTAAQSATSQTSQASSTTSGTTTMDNSTTTDAVESASQGDNTASNIADGDKLADRGSLLRDAPDAGMEAQVAQPQSYTISSGDNLWNIARDQLGSGTRWTEIYQMNADVIGNNPDLVFAGTELKLPGVENIAGNQDYIVQSGDNLWNIARDNLGAGSKWPSIYNGNTDIIGGDPSLIHPGQHLALSGNHHGSLQIAHSHHGHQMPTHHHSPSHHGASHASNAHTAHATPKPAATHKSTDVVAQNSNSNMTPNTPPLKAANPTEGMQKTASLPADSEKLVGLKAVAKSL